MQVLVIIAGDQLNHGEHDYWCIDKSHKISLRYRSIIPVNGHCWLDWHEKLGKNLIKVQNVTSVTGLSKTMIRCFYHPLILKVLCFSTSIAFFEKIGFFNLRRMKLKTLLTIVHDIVSSCCPN